MNYVRFGKTGMKVSRLCLGCMTYGSSKWRPWVLDEKASMPFFKEAYEAGVTFWDTADMYSLGESEVVTGKALKTFAARRDEIVLATKVYNATGPGPNQRSLSRKHIMEGIDASLKRLGTDYVDLYIIHRFDPVTPIEETVEALNDVVRAGKALYLGASSMYAWQLMKLLSAQRLRGFSEFVSMQNLVNLVYREEEREMLPLCRDQGLAVTPWSPLARGYLTGAGVGAGAKTERGRTDTVSSDMLKLGSAQDEKVRLTLEKEAKRLGVKPAVLALAWVLHRPGITSPIVGASKPHHLADALVALDVKLDDKTIARLDAPYRPKPVAGFS